MRKDDKNKTVEFSDAENIIIDRIYKDMAESYLTVLAKYKDSEDNQIPIFMATAKFIDKLHGMYTRVEQIVNKLHDEKVKGK